MVAYRPGATLPGDGALQRDKKNAGQSSVMGAVMVISIVMLQSSMRDMPTSELTKVRTSKRYENLTRQQVIWESWRAGSCWPAISLPASCTRTSSYFFLALGMRF